MYVSKPCVLSYFLLFQLNARLKTCISSRQNRVGHFVYVSKPRVLSSSWRLVHNASHPKSWPLEDPQKVIHIDTILILVYIHTYPVFARRINIVHLMRASRNPSACHGKRSNISGVEICLRESVESSKIRLILIWSKNVSFPLKRSRSTLTKSPPIFFENLARNS